MEREFLDLTPKRFLCPYCGKWHKWEKRELGYYESENFPAKFECSSYPRPSICYRGDYRIYFFNHKLYYSTGSMCLKANQTMEGEVPISDIVESADAPIVTFKVAFKAEEDVGSSSCSGCIFFDDCICVKLGDEGNGRNMTITFGFEFDREEYEQFAKASKLARKEKELEERERALKEREKAIESKEKGFE